MLLEHVSNFAGERDFSCSIYLLFFFFLITGFQILSHMKRIWVGREFKISENRCCLGAITFLAHFLVQILKKIFYSGHIALGNELVKFSSIQLALGDPAAADTIHEIDAIFSKHYGKHAEVLFPYLQHLKREAHRLVDGERS